MSEVKRYELVSRNRGMESWNEMQERADGDYVTFEDFELATKARDGVFSQVVKSLTAERDDWEKQWKDANFAQVQLRIHLANLGGWREAVSELEDFCHEPVRLKNMMAALDQIDELAKFLRV